MARICKDLCDTVNTIPNGRFTIHFGSRFSLVNRSKEAATPSVNTSVVEVDIDTVSEDLSGQDLKSRRDNVDEQEGHREDREAEAVSSSGEDMEGYESDTSSSSSGEDVVVEESGDSEEEVLEEDEATVMADIEQLKVHSSVQCYLLHLGLSNKVFNCLFYIRTCREYPDVIWVMQMDICMPIRNQGF